MDAVIGIDVGTTACNVAACDTQGGALAAAAAGHRTDLDAGRKGTGRAAMPCATTSELFARHPWDGSFALAALP